MINREAPTLRPITAVIPKVNLVAVVSSLALSTIGAHVQRTGVYHYHSLSIGLLEELDAEKKNFRWWTWAT